MTRYDSGEPYLCQAYMENTSTMKWVKAGSVWNSTLKFTVFLLA